MTKMFALGIKAVEALPPDQQDLAGALRLDLAKAVLPGYALTPEQIEDLEESIVEADRGEFSLRGGSSGNVAQPGAMRVRYTTRAERHLRGIDAYYPRS